jgi:hypothetical protein
MHDIRQLVENAGIEITEALELTDLEDLPEGWEPGSRHWSVTMYNRSTGESLTAPWIIGPAADWDTTDAAEVLDTMASGAVSYDTAPTFEEYAAEFGLNPDSRREEAGWRKLGEASDDLERFLGRDYQTFLYDTERL